MSPLKNLGTISMEEKENKYWKAYLVIKVMNMKTKKKKECEMVNKAKSMMNEFYTWKKKLATRNHL